MPGYSQMVLITGHVVNQKSGETLANVNIFESFAGIGTLTNFSGYFSMMLKPGNAEIEFTQSGFKDYSKKLVIQKDTTITISLMPLVNLKSKTKDNSHQKTDDKPDKLK